MDHAPVDIEPKTPWWFPLIGAILLLGGTIWLLTSDDGPKTDAAAPAASASATP